MQLQVITLPQRKQYIQSEMQRMGIDAVYWNAVVLPHAVRAINLSHRRIVSWAKTNHLPEVAIAEDDCYFTSPNGWNYFLEHKPTDFDLYLGGHYSGIKNKDNTIFGFTGFHLYIVHQRFYDTFLSVNPGRSIDAAMTGLGKFIVCDPLVAKQKNGYSYHRKQMVDDDHYLSNKTFLTA